MRQVFALANAFKEGDLAVGGTPDERIREDAVLARSRDRRFDDELSTLTIAEARRELLGASTVQVGDRVVLLLGGSLGSSVPKVGDQITIEGVTSRVIDVERDPAAATYACLTRK